MLQIVQYGVPGCVSAEGHSLEEALRYGNQWNLEPYHDAVREKIKDGVCSGSVLVVPRFEARNIKGLRVSLLGGLVIKKVRIVNDLSSKFETDDRKAGVNCASI